jgi:hypothetical protein
MIIASLIGGSNLHMEIPASSRPLDEIAAKKPNESYRGRDLLKLSSEVYD